MARKECPICRQSNAPESEYCHACGAALSAGPLVVSRPAPLQLNQALPPEQLKRVAATLAVGFAAVLAEAGLRYLQQRLDEMPPPRLRRRAPQSSTAVVPVRPNPSPAEQDGNGRVITVISERVIEEKRWGRPVRRVVERFAWRAEEKRGPS